MSAAEDTAVGLTQNVPGVKFKCGTCKWHDAKNEDCENPNKKLNGRTVQPDWCCNLYKHPGMRVVVA